SFALFFSTAHAQTSSQDQFLAQHGLQGKTPVEMIDYIDQLPQARLLSYNASVTATQLKLSDGKNTYTYALPEDKFYLSIAPYVTYTHDCFNHSLSGCRAELTNTPYQVTVKDEAGNILFNNAVVSFSNGFYGLWLPRNTRGTVEVEYNGLKGAFPFSSSSQSQTCMTTIRLQ
ncbi:MAG: copper-binding periplasmic metallochaperone CueP, partial [Saezia sp.]